MVFMFYIVLHLMLENIQPYSGYHVKQKINHSMKTVGPYTTIRSDVACYCVGPLSHPQVETLIFRNR